MPLAHHSVFSDQWRSPSALCSTLTIFGCLLFRGFFVTSLSGFIPIVAVLRGLFFTPRHFLPFFLHFLSLTLSPHFGAFVTQMQTGTPHPRPSSMPALTEFAVLASAVDVPVTRSLCYWLTSEPQSINWKLIYWIYFRQADARLKAHVKNSKHLSKPCWKVLLLTVSTRV